MTALKKVWASILFSAAMAGCGSDGAPSPTSDPTLFVGTWNVVAGVLSIVCSNGVVQTIEITTPTTFVMGTTSDIADTDATCPLFYDVAGDVATGLSGQSCTRPDVITKMNFEDLTFTLHAGGLGALSASGTLDRFNDITVGSPVNCTWTESGMYKRS